MIGIKNALSGLTAKDLNFSSMLSVERIRQLHFTHLILKFCKDLRPVLIGVDV